MIETDDLAEELIDRGVNPTSAREFVAQLDAEAIGRTIGWFDGQSGRVGAGVLVAELKRGGRPAQRAGLIEEQRQYGQDITDWLRKHFPEFDRPRFGPHPAAVAAVIQLHHRDGKRALTKRRHGAEIRAAVKRWEDRAATESEER
jgi:hypothetical protein